MTDFIIVAVLAIVVLLGVRSGLKHFKGESSCCGGGTYKAKPRKLSKVVGRNTYKVTDMTCQHCVNRVTEAMLIQTVKEVGYDMEKIGK